VTLRIKDAVCDRFREEGALRPSVSVRDPDVRIHAYLTQDQYQLYLDTSGAPLYQRGFRDVSVIAPLRENLAAGIIMLSGWIPGTPFLDPMCGSGTFLIEAAMMAVNQPPGMKRTFGFQKLTSFDEGLWKKIETEAMNKMKPIEFLDIYGSDMDLRAVRVARHNLKVAGLEEVAKVIQSDFVKLEPPASEGTLVTNPPYGQRIGEDEDLKEVYPVWAKHMKESFGGWNTYFLTADLEMPKDMRLKPSKKTPLYNGALECRLFEIKMVAGSNRKPKD
jgi:putative N6-adenine-specific DNA methylase